MNKIKRPQVPPTKDTLDEDTSAEFLLTLIAWADECRKRGWTTKMDLVYFAALYKVWMAYPNNPKMKDIRKFFAKKKGNIRDIFNFWRSRGVLRTYRLPNNLITYYVEVTEVGRAVFRSIHPHDFAEKRTPAPPESRESPSRRKKTAE